MLYTFVLALYLAGQVSASSGGLCQERQLNGNAVAGASCLKEPARRLTDEDEEEDSYGESIFGFTEANCTAAGGHWTTYLCNGIEEVCTHPDFIAHPEALELFRFLFQDTCCVDQGVTILAVAANSAGGATMNFGTDNLYPASIYGETTPGMKIFTGSLVLAVNNPDTLVGDGTVTPTVKDALKAGIAEAIAGVEASMVMIMGVKLSTRRLGSSSRRLQDSNVEVKYVIKAQQGSSLTTSQIGGVGNQFTTPLNTQLTNAGIAVTVATTQSPAPVESVVPEAATTVAASAPTSGPAAATTVAASAPTSGPAATTEEPSLVDACQMSAASSVWAMALMTAAVAKAIF